MSVSDNTDPRRRAEQQQSIFFSQLDSKLRSVVDEIKQIDEQIAPLRNRRTFLASERDRLKKYRYEPRTFEVRSGMGQGLYVQTRYFMPYINEWIFKYNAEHGGAGGQRTLSARSSVSAKNIRSYNNGTITHAGILSVDRLLTAIDRQDVMDLLPFRTAHELQIGNRISQQVRIQ